MQKLVLFFVAVTLYGAITTNARLPRLMNIVSNDQRLLPGGKNVGEYSFYYQTYKYSQKSHLAHTNRRTCCRRFIFCVKHCTKTRTKRIYYQESRLETRHYTTYRCKPGYAVADEPKSEGQLKECKQPICEPPCENGECVKPQTCECKGGFNGKQCENEINECEKKPPLCSQVCTNLWGSFACTCHKGFVKTNETSITDPGCRNVDECAVAKGSGKELCSCLPGTDSASRGCKATCVDTPGSYRCQCSKGYTLQYGKVCTDTDECTSGEHNCDQICWNDVGHFKCSCYPGYALAADKHTCNDVDECAIANGQCEQICTNTRGSFKCSCKPGFILEKNRCKDINECKLGRPCDHMNGICRNELGSYSCSCKIGYQLQADKKTCKDINECAGFNECEQDCINNDGSYYCTCRWGFRLKSDGKTCEDINECTEGLHKCTQNCTNIYGSYVCTCRDGYYLDTDKYTCIGTPCSSLIAPHHGNIECTGFHVNDYCTFSCKPGYQIEGYVTTTCKSTSKWSNDIPKCVPAVCESPKPLINGVLSQPCAEEFTSKCFIRCKDGYKLEGEPIVSCDLYQGRLKWFTKATCQEVSICKKNPCLNGGKCTVISQRHATWKCDCLDTGYHGKLCQRGVAEVPDFPQMILGEKTDQEFTIRAKPSKHLIIKLSTVVNNSVTFEPQNAFSIYAPRDTVRFRVIPLRAGVITIRYTLYGEDSYNFDPIKNGQIYVFNAKDKKRLSNIPTQSTLKGGCNDLHLETCKDGSAIQLKSSCKWHGSGTYGHVTVNSKSTSLPVSMSGLNFPANEGVSRQFTTYGVLSVAKLTQEMLTSSRKSCQSNACPTMNYTKADNDFFIKRSSLIRSYYNTVNSLIPWWIHINIPSDYDGFHVNDVQSILLKSYKMESFPIQTCANIPRGLEGTHSVLVSRAPVNIDVFGKPTAYTSTFPACTVHDLCKQVSYYSLPNDKKIKMALTEHLKFNIEGFGFANNQPIRTACLPFWNGILMKDENFCVASNTWSKLEMDFVTENAKLKFQGEVRGEAKDLDSVVFERFNSPLKSYMRGYISGNIFINVFGWKINLLQNNISANIYSHVGGVREKNSMVKGTKGIRISMAATDVEMDHGTSALRLYPSTTSKNTTVQAALYYDIIEGQVESLYRPEDIKLNLNKFRSALSKVGRLKSTLKRAATKYTYELSNVKKQATNLYKKQKEAIQLLKIFARVKIKPMSNYKKLVEIVNVLKSDVSYLIDGVVALDDAVKITETSQELIDKFHKACATSISSLKSIDAIRMKFTSAKLFEENQGVSLNYFGQVCVHSLCFSNSIVSVFDLKNDVDVGVENADDVKKKNDKHSLADYTYVTSVSTKTRKLGPYFKIPPQGKVKIKMYKKTLQQFVISFPAIVSVFGSEFNTTVSIDQKDINMRLRSVYLPHIGSFDITASDQFRLTTKWDDIDFTYGGMQPKLQLSGQQLQEVSDKLLSTIAIRTKTRLGNFYGKQKDLSSQIGKLSKELKRLEKESDDKDKAYRLAKQSFERVKTNLTKEIIRFHSTVTLNMSQILDKECVLMHCGQHNETITLHDICQKKMARDINLFECFKSVHITRYTHEKTFASQCPLVKHILTEIYTGTCPKAGMGPLKSSMISTGAAVGAAVGTIVPGVGTAVGAAVGAIVGFITSLFSACDESYETLQQVAHSIVNCVRMKTVTASTTFTLTKCIDKKRRLVLGYQEPEMCKKGAPTTVMTTDPQCIVSNDNCNMKREKLRKQFLTKLNITNDIWLHLESVEKKVDAMYPNVVRLDNARSEARRKYERTYAHQHRALLDQTLTKQSITNITRFMLREVCFMRVYNESEIKKGFIAIDDLSFKTRSPDAQDLSVDMKANRKGVAPTSSAFRYVFNDEINSIHDGLLRILESHLCQNTLYKAGESNHQAVPYMNFPFAALPTNNDQVKETELLCLSTKRIFDFLQKLTERLEEAIKKAILYKSDIELSQVGLQTVIRNLKRHASDPLVRAELAVVTDSLERNNEALEELSVDNILHDWKQNMELFTNSLVSKACFGTHDCIESAIQNLLNVPSMYKATKTVYVTQVHKVKDVLDKIYGKKKFKDLDDVKQTALDLQKDLASLKDSTSFCSQPPVVRITSPLRVSAFVGDVIELKCNAESDLPVTYSWKHRNKTLPFEQSSTLRIFVQNSTCGGYVCEAWNRVGRNFSSETFLMLQQKPRIVRQPKDVSFLNTVIGARVKPYFYCNVTADPEPTLSWYRQSFRDPTRVLKLHEFSPILRVKNPSEADNGFYFCVASNKHGSVQSRNARLDVMSGELPQQQHTVTFNFPMNRTAAVQGKYEEKLKKDIEPATNQACDVNLEDAGEHEVKVNVKIDDQFDTYAYGMNGQDMLKRIAFSRKMLSEGVQKAVSGIVDTHSEHFSSEMERSMSLGYDGDKCKAGYFLHENGFTCAPCPSGHYEFLRKCYPCPLGTYQPEIGRTSCTECRSMSQVTEDVGSMSQHSCRDPVLDSMDIIFVIDTSASLPGKEFVNVREFISGFVRQYLGPGENVKFGLITYDEGVEYSVKISDYKHNMQTLLHRLDQLKQSKNNVRRTEKALNLALKEFSREMVGGRPKILVSFMTGMTSSNQHGVSGFQLLRNQSVNLRMLHVHSVAVGVGSSVDRNELLALASLNKEKNVLTFRKSVDMWKDMQLVPATIVKGAYRFSGKDIAVAIDSCYHVDDVTWANTLHFVQLFMQEFLGDELTKIGLLTYGESKIKKSSFKVYQNKAEINETLSSLSRLRGSHDERAVLDFLYNSYLTERHNSSYGKKIILLISRSAIDDEVLANINRMFTKEDVTYLNVVMSLEKKTAGVSEMGIEESRKVVYSLAEATELVTRVKELRERNHHQQPSISNEELNTLF